jgi:translation elongation factor EF-Tu-like GTPase
MRIIVKSGPFRDEYYHPQLYYEGRNWDVRLQFPEASVVSPGNTVRAYIAFLSPKCNFGKIHNNMKFEIREGGRTVGHGEVTSILELEHSAKRMTDNT